MSPELMPAVISIAVVVLLLLGALRVAAAYRRMRRTVRRWGRTRLTATQTTARRTRRGRR